MVESTRVKEIEIDKLLFGQECLISSVAEQVPLW